MSATVSAGPGLARSVIADDVDFGPNVTVFDPGMSRAAVQAQIDAVYAVQQNNQFGPARNALLFKPGTDDGAVPVGFYTEIAGLGRPPEQVALASVHSDAFLPNNNATCNFWR